MNQLEQIEARAAEAERKRDKAHGQREPYRQYDREVSAYTQAAALARPLQKAVDGLRCNIWTLFAFEEILNEKAELSTRAGADFEATFYRARADAAVEIATTLHCCLEHAGLC